MGDFLRVLLIHDWITAQTQTNNDENGVIARGPSCMSLVECCFWDQNDCKLLLENSKLSHLLLSEVEKLMSDRILKRECSAANTIRGQQESLSTRDSSRNMQKLLQEVSHFNSATKRNLVKMFVDAAIDSEDQTKLILAKQFIESSEPKVKNELETEFILVSRKLDMLETKRSISKTRNSRNVSRASSVIGYAKTKSYLLKELQCELASLELAFSVWNGEERIRRTKISVDSKTIAELKSYCNPAKEVFCTVKASFILLGFESKNLLNWGDCLIIFSTCKASKTDMLKFYNNLNCGLVSLETAMEAESCLGRFSFEKVQRVSAGAALIYKWVLQKVSVVKRYWGINTESHSF